ncbi:MAG: penicillin-binding protein 2 [Thermoleophilia bacterium]|jgi:penicillin-binding protein 2
MKLLPPVKKKTPPQDDSFKAIRVGVLLLIALLLLGVLGFRLWFLQILTGDEYVASAENNRVREVVVEAPRGVIYDRNGRIMVENRAGLSVGLLPMDMIDPDDDPAGFRDEISRLADVLDMPVADLEKAYEKATQDPYMTLTVKEDVSKNTVVAYLKEHRLEFPGVQVEKSFVRNYPMGSFATHVVGYVGGVSAADLDEEQFATLSPVASVGKSGLERIYDSKLRGTDGWKAVEVDAFGHPKRFLEDVPPKPGNNLVLTIDNEVQQAAESAIEEGIQRAHQDGYKEAAGGAVVALDPRNGQVLALASYPDYDPSLWVGGMGSVKYKELTDEAAHNPLFDRAVNGLYPAGSTFKPFVAAAALNAGLVTPNTAFTCRGMFRASSQTWKCWDSGGHGTVGLVSALAESCDVYFYNLGRLLYEQKSPVLQDSVRLFGFGRATGIDLPNETTRSRVPDKDWKAAAGRTASDKLWRPGDEINLAIGQGDLLVTPLQLAVGLSAIANGGTVWVPHLGLQITDASGNVIHQIEKEKRGELGISEDVLAPIKQGMRMVTSSSDGTAHAAFVDFPVTVAGKTGTAEKKPEDDYALFMGYAPADGSSEPEIVVVAIMEQGGHGSSVAAPMVRRVMDAYFRTESEELDVVPATE